MIDASSLKGVSSASLTDAMGRKFQHRAHILDLVSPTPGRVMVGPAVTVSYIPLREDLADPAVHTFARLFYEAVGDGPEGKVLAMPNGGYPNSSLGGGTKLSRLHNHGMAGVLTDGRLRDFHELRDFGFGSYCSGTTVRWGGDTLMPYQANVPVVVGGVTIVPGDIIYADEAAAVVIPAAAFDDIVAEAQSIEIDDAKFITQIKNEDPAEIRAVGSRER